MRYSQWRCSKCKDTFITDSKLRHAMVFCGCGESGVDDEEHYRRFVGNIPILVGQSNDINKF